MMKRILLFLTILIVGISIVGCDSDTIKVPNFVGSPYGDVIDWAKENDIDIKVTSEYNDDVEPFSVITQSVTAGEKMLRTDELVILYSRGFDPEGEITIPDFTGNTVDDIKAWLNAEDISKYYFYETFSPDTPVGEYVGYEVSSFSTSEVPLRKDTYTFYFSLGDIEVEDVVFDNPDTIRGVNLGGWFVLEGWMSPDLFEGVSGSDETIFMEEKPNALQAIEQHWDTFITESDFAWLEAHGVTHVRLPIPWWLFGETFTYTHEGVTHTVTYGRSITYIERAMEWAETYNIKVLLDLHTAPGGQNGFDNGGITDVLQWEQSQNVEKTVEVIGDIAEHFSSYDSLWGIEVLNEPGWGVNMSILQGYYLDAYQAIREHNQTVWVGFHDGFRGYLTSTWNNFFNNNNFTNVFFDIHLYQTFGDSWTNMDIFDHVNYVHTEQYGAIHQLDSTIPVVIGEWSLGLQGNVFEGLNQDGVNQVRMAFGNAQLNEFENAFGWFFWSYKIDRDSHLEWDFRRLVEAGIFPDNFDPYIED